MFRFQLLAPYLMLVLGLAQILADTVNLAPLKAIAAATGASPAPKVFSSVRGLETFSSKFSLEWTDLSGEKQTLELTPAIGAKLKGPYNRRNVYGAVISYAPALRVNPYTLPMLRSIYYKSVCTKSSLLSELEIQPQGSVLFRVIPKTSTFPDPELEYVYWEACEK